MVAGSVTLVQGCERLFSFFSVQRLHGFRQVVQHVLFYVAKWD